MFKKTALLIFLVVVLTSASLAQQSFPVTTVWRGNSQNNSVYVYGLSTVPNSYDIAAKLHVDVDDNFSYMVSGKILHGSSISCSLVGFGQGPTPTGGVNISDVFNNTTMTTTTAEVNIQDLLGTAEGSTYYRVGEAAEGGGDD